MFSFAGCNRIKDISGTYEFDRLIYLAPFSSSTFDYAESRMAGTKYIIGQDVFEIDSPDGDIQIMQPIYVKEKMDEDMVKEFYDSLFLGETPESEYGKVSLSEYKNKYRYVLCDSENEKKHIFLYAFDDELWLATYVDNTAGGQVLMANIYKLK